MTINVYYEQATETFKGVEIIEKIQCDLDSITFIQLIGENGRTSLIKNHIKRIEIV